MVASVGTEHGVLGAPASVVGACRLSCPAACGVVVPQQRAQPMSPAFWKAGFLYYWTTREDSSQTTLTPVSFLYIKRPIAVSIGIPFKQIPFAYSSSLNSITFKKKNILLI